MRHYYIVLGTEIIATSRTSFYEYWGGLTASGTNEYKVYDRGLKLYHNGRLAGWSEKIF